MKKINCAILLIGLIFNQLAAQQEPQFTQFMYNKLGLNPGYAGAIPSPTLTALYRNQWLGLEGAPTVQALSYSQPMLQQRVGIGANLTRSEIGISRAVTLDVAYSYRIFIRKGCLGVGVQAGVRHLRQNWSDARLVATNGLAGDASIPTEPKSKGLPNFGFGLYYAGERCFLGLSVPRLVANNIDFAEKGAEVSREAQHVYAMAGVNFRLGDGVLFTPQLLVKYVKNTPLDAEINGNFRFVGRFLAGLTYRAGSGKTAAGGESLDVLAGVQVTEKIFFGLSYDIGLTKLRKFNNGSIEATARYYFVAPAAVEDPNQINPRNPWD